MLWIGIEGGVNATKQGENAIICPKRYCYLDSFQDALPYWEISGGRYLLLEYVYFYNFVFLHLVKILKIRFREFKGVYGVQ